MATEPPKEFHATRALAGLPLHCGVSDLLIPPNTQEVARMIILAIDLGKFNSVACRVVRYFAGQVRSELFAAFL
jgi:hypothetical protein